MNISSLKNNDILRTLAEEICNHTRQKDEKIRELVVSALPERMKLLTSYIQATVTDMSTAESTPRNSMSLRDISNIELKKQTDCPSLEQKGKPKSRNSGSVISSHSLKQGFDSMVLDHSQENRGVRSVNAMEEEEGGSQQQQAQTSQRNTSRKSPTYSKNIKDSKNPFSLSKKSRISSTSRLSDNRKTPKKSNQSKKISKDNYTPEPIPSSVVNPFQFQTGNKYSKRAACVNSLSGLFNVVSSFSKYFTSSKKRDPQVRKSIKSLRAKLNETNFKVDNETKKRLNDCSTKTQFDPDSINKNIDQSFRASLANKVVETIINDENNEEEFLNYLKNNEQEIQENLDTKKIAQELSRIRMPSEESEQGINIEGLENLLLSVRSTILNQENTSQDPFEQVVEGRNKQQKVTLMRGSSNLSGFSFINKTAMDLEQVSSCNDTLNFSNSQQKNDRSQESQSSFLDFKPISEIFPKMDPNDSFDSYEMTSSETESSCGSPSRLTYLNKILFKNYSGSYTRGKTETKLAQLEELYEQASQQQLRVLPDKSYFSPTKKKVLIPVIGNKRVPGWAADKEGLRKRLVLQNQESKIYREIFGKIQRETKQQLPNLFGVKDITRRPMSIIPQTDSERESSLKCRVPDSFMRR